MSVRCPAGGIKGAREAGSPEILTSAWSFSPVSSVSCQHGEVESPHYQPPEQLCECVRDGDLLVVGRFGGSSPVLQ
ncbi:MAG: hypothetical protein ACOCTQ_01380 [Planctomycetota bacterium]